MVLLQECHQRLTRSIAVARTDADRSEEHSILRVTSDERADTPPQQQQRRVISPIFDTHEGAPKFQRRRQTLEQMLVIAEKRSRVEPLNTGRRDNQIGTADSIRSHYLTAQVVP